MVNITIALVMAVLVTNIYHRKDTFEVCPRWIVRIAKRHYPEFVNHLQRRTREENSPPRLPICNGGNSMHDHAGGCVHVHEGGCLTPHTPLTTRASSSTRSSLRNPPNENSRRLCGFFKLFGRFKTSTDTTVARGRRQRSQRNVNLELNCAEWQMVSKFLDKALFWLYLLISCSLQVLLFLQMWWQSPPTSGDTVDVSDIE